MHLTLRLAGHELVHLELTGSEPTTLERSRLEASGGGQFELDPFGFESATDAALRGIRNASTVPRR